MTPHACRFPTRSGLKHTHGRAGAIFETASNHIALRWVLVLYICVVGGTSQASETQDPRDLVDTTIETLRENVNRDAAILDTDPGHALVLVASVVAPHIDMRLASRLVLGKH